MKRLRKNKNKGILFWITGLSGCGKTSIAEELENDIKKKVWHNLNLEWR